MANIHTQTHSGGCMRVTSRDSEKYRLRYGHQHEQKEQHQLQQHRPWNSGSAWASSPCKLVFKVVQAGGACPTWASSPRSLVRHPFKAKVALKFFCRRICTVGQSTLFNAHAGGGPRRPSQYLTKLRALINATPSKKLNYQGMAKVELFLAVIIEGESETAYRGTHSGVSGKLISISWWMPRGIKMKRIMKDIRAKILVQMQPQHQTRSQPNASQ